MNSGQVGCTGAPAIDDRLSHFAGQHLLAVGLDQARRQPGNLLPDDAYFSRVGNFIADGLQYSAVRPFAVGQFAKMGQCTRQTGSDICAQPRYQGSKVRGER